MLPLQHHYKGRTHYLQHNWQPLQEWVDRHMDLQGAQPVSMPQAYWHSYHWDMATVSETVGEEVEPFMEKVGLCGDTTALTHRVEQRLLKAHAPSEPLFLLLGGQPRCVLTLTL
jgi:hypothetical protein